MEVVKNTKYDISIIEKEDRSISFAIIFQFSMLITNYTFKHVFKINNHSIRATISAIFMLLVGIVFISNLRIVLHRTWKLFVSTYYSFIFIVLLNLLIFNQNTKYILDISFNLFFICIPIFLYYISIVNKLIFLNMLIKSAYYQITIAIIFFMYVDLSVYQYDMVYSYLVLVPIIILLYKIYNDFKILDLILIVFGIISIIVLGSRGPLLAIIIYYLISRLNKGIRSKNMIKKIVLPSLLVFTVICIRIYYKQILHSIEKILNTFNLNSRTFMILLSENIDYSSGRNMIYRHSIDLIIDKPILGYGLAGDRILLNGTYPHNIILEILMQFGLIIGGLILIIFLIYWFIAMFKNDNSVEQDLAIMFFGIGLVQLFVSGSYIISSNFWLFMAICINSVHFRKLKYNSNSKISNGKIKIKPPG